MAITGDPKSFICDPNSIRWMQTGLGASSKDAPLNVRPSSSFFNRGQQSWPLVVRSKPAMAGGHWATAIPSSAMPGPISTPVRQGCSVSAKNLYGLPIFTIGYQFLLQPGAGASGSGKYITRLEITPGNVDVAQGWTVDMTAAIQNPCEYGEPGALSAVLPVQMQVVIETQIKRDQAGKLHIAFPLGVLIARAPVGFDAPRHG